eukprot:TRINITY_DN366_c0_g1_i1.p2 TRINITY_DN366_c0_g1~~TRINITY_DN366_c0_g1_i1.p2  ORF type:complete len:90 (+),score=28.59 TRINITY_DN366_c0_g1_i1:30-272(+)
MDDMEKVDVFVEVLNKYLYFIADGCKPVTDEMVMGLRKHIETLLEDMEDETAEQADSIRTFYRNTQKYIESSAKPAEAEA